MTKLTHYQIKQKFLIEYDKEATSGSSYPSLTDVELASVLDKAYRALIAQKLTGNNPRRAGFEVDTKALEDLRPLVVTTPVKIAQDKDKNLIILDDNVRNEVCFILPDRLLYFIQATCEYGKGTNSIIKVISHDAASNFFQTEYNTPWLKYNVAYIEGDVMAVLYDYFKSVVPIDVHVTYIKEPDPFLKWNREEPETDFGDTEFELDQSVAEEFINLAVAMALENVESSRLQTKLATRSLES